MNVAATRRAGTNLDRQRGNGEAFRIGLGIHRSTFINAARSPSIAISI
jgi:hypothetical protein